MTTKRHPQGNEGMNQTSSVAQGGTDNENGRSERGPGYESLLQVERSLIEVSEAIADRLKHRRDWKALAKAAGLSRRQQEQGLDGIENLSVRELAAVLEKAGLQITCTAA